MKKIVVSFIVMAMMLILSIGCNVSPPSAEQTQAAATKRLTQAANDMIGMPAITNFQERKLMKMIMELRDKEDLICHAYLKADLSGKLVYIGKCIGFGLPYSVQYTNPEVITKPHNLSERFVLPQPDPNGLFMPDGLSATWLMMIDDKGKPHPVYFEPEIVVSPFKLLIE